MLLAVTLPVAFAKDDQSMDSMDSVDEFDAEEFGIDEEAFLNEAENAESLPKLKRTIDKALGKVVKGANKVSGVSQKVGRIADKVGSVSGKVSKAVEKGAQAVQKATQGARKFAAKFGLAKLTDKIGAVAGKVGGKVSEFADKVGRVAGKVKNIAGKVDKGAKFVSKAAQLGRAILNGKKLPPNLQVVDVKKDAARQADRRKERRRKAKGRRQARNARLKARSLRRKLERKAAHSREQRNNIKTKAKLEKLQAGLKKSAELHDKLKQQASNAVEAAHQEYMKAALARDAAIKASEHSLEAYAKHHFKPKKVRVEEDFSRVIRRVNENEPNSAFVPKEADEWTWENQTLEAAKKDFDNASLHVHGLIVDTTADTDKKVSDAIKIEKTEAGKVAEAAKTEAELELQKKKAFIHYAGEKAVEKWSQKKADKVDAQFKAESDAYHKQLAQDAQIAANNDD